MRLPGQNYINTAIAIMLKPLLFPPWEPEWQASQLLGRSLLSLCQKSSFMSKQRSYLEKVIFVCYDLDTDRGVLSYWSHFVVKTKSADDGKDFSPYYELRY